MELQIAGEETVLSLYNGSADIISNILKFVRDKTIKEGKIGTRKQVVQSLRVSKREGSENVYGLCQRAVKILRVWGARNFPQDFEVIGSDVNECDRRRKNCLREKGQKVLEKQQSVMCGGIVHKMK